VGKPGTPRGAVSAPTAPSGVITRSMAVRDLRRRLSNRGASTTTRTASSRGVRDPAFLAHPGRPQRQGGQPPITLDEMGAARNTCPRRAAASPSFIYDPISTHGDHVRGPGRVPAASTRSDAAGGTTRPRRAHGLPRRLWPANTTTGCSSGTSAIAFNVTS
jgi:hypothetical protein